LEKEKDAELKNENLTQSQKEKINEKYAKKEAEVKLAAWKEEQNAKVSQAEMSAALAIINALATVPYPGNIAVAAGIAGLAAVQITNIESQSPPKFYQGVEYLERGSNPVGRDTIPVMAHEGERIVNHENNQRYYESYSILQNERVSPEYALKVLQGPEIPVYSHPQITSEMVDKSITVFSPNQIDYTRLGKSVANEMLIGFDDVAEQVIKGREDNNELLGMMIEKMDVKQNTISPRHGRV
jgi:hypothetical protein